MRDATDQKWATADLASVSKVFTDGNWIETKDQASEGIRLVQTGNVGEGVFKDRRDKARWIDDQTFDRLNCFEVMPGDCLVSRLPDPVGRACIIPETGDKMITAVDCTVIRPDEAKIDPQFFVYYSQSSEYLRNVDDRCTGTTRRRISRKNLGKIPIPLPPLEEQQRIVAVLDEAFEGLTRARAHAEANLQNAQDLFESLRFVMLSEQTEGWETHPLADCFRLKSGENLTAKKMVPGPFPVYGGNGIAGTHDACNLSGDNVIIGRVGALCGNARYIDHDIWLTDNAFKVVNYNFDFDHRFLAYLLNFKNLRSLARQAAQPVISNSSLADLELTFPASVELQADLAVKLANAETELEDIQKKYEAKLQDLDDLRQSLLQKAFAGELT